MKIKFFYFIIFFSFIHINPLFAMDISDFKFQAYNRPFYTKEEFYTLYRETLYRKESNFNANLHWLEYTKAAPFAIPVKALAKIESQVQWDEYKRLFMFHINFLMMDNYIRLAEQFEKPHILFFNTQFKKEIKEGLEMAQAYYKYAKQCLKDAKAIGKDAWNYRDDTPMSLDGEEDKWMDTLFRMQDLNTYHELNYDKEIDLRLQQVGQKIAQVDKL